MIKLGGFSRAYNVVVSWFVKPITWVYGRYSIPILNGGYKLTYGKYNTGWDPIVS
jgi:hypothetical protein